MNLLEASLARIWDHYHNSQFAIITAWRQDQSKEANEARLKKLESDLRENGMGFVPIIGVGQEDIPGGGQTEVKEQSLIAIPKEQNDKFRDIIIGLGQKYSQYAVIVHTPTKEEGKEPVTELITLVPSVKIEQSYSKISFNKLSKFYSSLYKGGRFAFEKIIAADYPRGTNLWMIGMARESNGEIFELQGSEENQLTEIIKYLQKGSST